MWAEAIRPVVCPPIKQSQCVQEPEPCADLSCTYLSHGAKYVPGPRTAFRIPVFMACSIQKDVQTVRTEGLFLEGSWAARASEILANIT